MVAFFSPSVAEFLDHNRSKDTFTGIFSLVQAFPLTVFDSPTDLRLLVSEPARSAILQLCNPLLNGSRKCCPRLVFPTHAKHETPYTTRPAHYHDVYKLVYFIRG